VTTADVLEALNWHDIQCQSPEGCKHRASVVLHVHVMDDCQHAEADRFGNVVAILCSQHALGVQVIAAEAVLQLRRYGIPLCKTCGAPLAQVKDVVREILTLGTVDR
jgi:hypothetical protein